MKGFIKFLVLFVVWSFLLSSFFTLKSFSQSDKGSDRAFSASGDIEVIQGLHFGNFYVGQEGGKIDLSPDGACTSDGSVIPAGGTCQEAVFRIRVPPRKVIYLEAEGGTLYGENGGEIELTIDPENHINTGTQFVTSPGGKPEKILRVGGTLNLDNAHDNPPGNYKAENGLTLTITIIQE